MASNRSSRSHRSEESPTSGEWREAVGCDPKCEYRYLCSFTRICCGHSQTLGEKIAQRARTLSLLLRDFVIQEGKKLGVLDVFVYDRFRQRIELSERNERESKTRAKEASGQ